jgi:hypothetical protein
LGIVWCEDAESDEQNVLATESGYERFVVIVRGLDDVDARRQLARAIWAGDCSEVESTGLQERFGDESTTSSASLW